MDILGNGGSYNNLFGICGERCQRKKQEAEAGLLKAEAYATMASRPAEKTSPLFYLIPIIGILMIGGIIIYKKRKG